MLTRVSVNGFRSLLDFETHLQAGMNVIVGPNGAGKSNFISFLDFLSTLVSEGLDSAISLAKGAGSIFSLEHHDHKSAYLEFSVTGQINIDSTNWYFGGKEYLDQTKNIIYNYSAKIVYNKRISQIYIENENLDIIPDLGRPLKIVRTTDVHEEKFKTSFKLNPHNSNLYKLLKDYLYYPGRHDSNNISVEDILEKLVAPGESLMEALPIHAVGIGNLKYDISSYRSINVVPDSARKSSPVSRLSPMESNGENLCSTLYRLSRGELQNYGGIFSSGDSSENQKSKFHSIVSWTKEVSENIIDLYVRPDLLEAMLKGFVKIKSADKEIEIPLSKISDGTIKWISLVTILLSQSRYKIIEEPENYLHPNMQESFVSLCNSIADNSENSNQYIISTHSQTLLNCCEVHQIILFDSINSRTRSRSASHKDELIAMMDDSGFGVGDLYRMGALYA